MASLYKKQFTKPLPDGAETFMRKVKGRKGEVDEVKRFARWEDGNGKTRTARVTIPEKGEHAGKMRIVQQAATWIARYRDGQNNLREVSTGCRDETAARQVLADLVKRAELVQSGVLTPAQDKAASHSDVPLTEHVVAYLESMKSKTVRGRKVSTRHRQDTERLLNKIVADCGFGRLADVNREAVEKWLNQREAEDMGGRTRNTYRGSLVSFCNWCVETDRLAANPLAKVCKAAEAMDRRHVRRALSEDELRGLLRAARERPLREARTIRRGEKKGEQTAELKPETENRLTLVGWERALVYKTAALTGLRRKELASLTVGQAYLDRPRPFVKLLAKDAKSGRGADIQLRGDLAGDVQTWLCERLAELQDAARAKGETIPAALPLDMPIFERVPSMRVFDLDLAAAKIAKEDARGRRVDFHSLRYSCATHLSLAGVSPRTAQAVMRHSKIDLTMSVYTDPELLDVAGAVAALPDLPLDGRSPAQERATGTCDAEPLAPWLAPVLAQSAAQRSPEPSREGGRQDRGKAWGCSQTPTGTQERRPLTSSVNSRQNEADGSRTRNLRIDSPML